VRVTLLIVASLIVGACATSIDRGAHSHNGMGGIAPPSKWECNAGAGNFERKDYPVHAESIVVSGLIIPVDRRSHEQWKPAAAIGISSKDDKNYAGVHLSVAAQTPELITIEADSDVNGTIVLGTIPWSSGAVRFKIANISSTLMSLEVASFRRFVNVGEYTEAVLTLGCSTGTFAFDSLSVGRKK
jgi:hypothetical protein